MSAPVRAPHELRVEPWLDAVVDTLGHDPRSRYVETYWLGILGPSTTWLFRLLADGFDDHPEGFDLPLADTAGALGLGMKTGRQGPFSRSLDRLCQFGLARRDHDTLHVRRFAPPLTQGQLKRLPEALQQRHGDWQRTQLHAASDGEGKARRLALTLLELGENLDAAERQLARWRIEGAVATRALAWANQRHAAAEAAAGLGGDAA
jgi:hypothetical protein